MDAAFLDKLKEIYIKQDGNDKAYQAEYPTIDKACDILKDLWKDTYSFLKPIGRGGSGIVIKIHDARLNLERALKLPRPIKEDLSESLKNEINHLSTIKHENIINIYTLGDLKIPGVEKPFPYFVMDYVKDARDLKLGIIELLTANPDSKDLPKLTNWIANKFYSIALALRYCHSSNIIHFDVKPANILLDTNDKPILSDLGFAKKKGLDEEPVVVGFTIFYSHPDLFREYGHMSSRNRVRKEIAPKYFKESWDIFAFGKSLLEVLSLVQVQFPDVVLYDYTFVYLHLCACRMLDGRNLRKEEVERIRIKQIDDNEDPSIFIETWMDLEAQEFDQIKYGTFNNVVKDFEKLMYNDLLLSKIPELNPYFHKRVQSSEGIAAPFSNRIKAIVEHPIFTRLSNIPQLGLVSKIYPTATHTRFEHSLGTFRNCCLYVAYLYNDNYNPLFKQLIDEQSAKTLLVASILHDLGHYPLAHEIEENLNELHHEKLTLEFLVNGTKDKDNRTLIDIIENEEWGWGIKMDSVKKLLTKKGELSLFSAQPLIFKMLSSILDGPIDVDKLDFLIRDSQSSYLKYGELVDMDRLLRNLTIIINRDSEHKISFIVGTYEKGQTAAESLTFARYLLYQSSYWHHTARSVRVMLSVAMSSALKIRSRKGNNIISEFKTMLGLDDVVKPVGIEDVLNFIHKHTDDSGKQLVDLIRQRNFYKRILTIHYEGENETVDKLLLRFREGIKKPEFNSKLQNNIKESYTNFLRQTTYPKISYLSPTITDMTLDILTQPNQILCDCPPPNFGTEGEMLRFIPEPERLQKNFNSRREAGIRVSEVWQQVHFKLMYIASKGRIYCNPIIRDTIMATLGPEGIKEILKVTLKQVGC